MNERDLLADALLIHREVSLLEEPGSEAAQSEPAYLDRCRAAAETAWALARLRRERQRAGFVPLAIGGYLQGLAKAARIDLKPVLAAFGIGALAPRDPAAARPLARLCRELEMSVKETFVHLGLGLAEQLGITPVPWFAARARGAVVSRDSVDESEQALYRALVRSGEKAAADLRALEAEVLAVYEG